MLDAYIYDGLRTPFGRHAGVLARVRPDDLLGDVLKAVMKRSPFKAEQVEDIIVGCANQGGEDSRCVARHAGLLAGLPIETPGTVLQRNCASGGHALPHGLIGLAQPRSAIRDSSGEHDASTALHVTCDGRRLVGL